MNSHFHWDHAGGNRLFSPRPLPGAGERVPLRAPARRLRQPSLRTGILRLRHCLRDAGRRYCRQARCGRVHHAGTHARTSVAARAAPSGAIMIMTGDAMFCPANCDLDLPPGNAHTTGHAIASIGRLRLRTQFLGADLVICHDQGFWSTWRPAPHRYR
ncbi:MAG: MBL fold metallo-hydrolase [Vicinamibacterales bacterium]